MKVRYDLVVWFFITFMVTWYRCSFRIFIPLILLNFRWVMIIIFFRTGTIARFSRLMFISGRLSLLTSVTSLNFIALASISYSMSLVTGSSSALLCSRTFVEVIEFSTILSKKSHKSMSKSLTLSLGLSPLGKNSFFASCRISCSVESFFMHTFRVLPPALKWTCFARRIRTWTVQCQSSDGQDLV